MYVRHIQSLAHNEHSINVTQYCHQIKKGQSTVSQSTFRACSSDFLTREGFTRKTENRSYIYMVSKYLTTSYLLITKGGSCNFIAETWRKHFTQVIKENLINTGTKSGVWYTEVITTSLMHHPHQKHTLEWNHDKTSDKPNVGHSTKSLACTLQKHQG